MLQLEIITPSQTVFSGEVETVFIPGKLGAFQVLPSHAPIISTLGKGILRYRQNGQKESQLHIEGGVVEVLHNRVKVLAERLISSS